MKILIVDDVALNHQLLAAVVRDLCSEGVLVAERATEAIEIALAEKPDLIFMDLALPDFSGLDAIDVIRSHPSTAHIPVIVVSAHVRPEVMARARQSGCDCYITKPISVKAVRDTVLRIKKERQNQRSHTPATIAQELVPSLPQY